MCRQRRFTLETHGAQVGEAARGSAKTRQLSHAFTEIDGGSLVKVSRRRVPWSAYVSDRGVLDRQRHALDVRQKG